MSFRSSFVSLRPANRAARATDAHPLVGIDARDGKERWRFKTGGMVRSTPAVDEDRVYFGGLDGKFYALAQ